MEKKQRVVIIGANEFQLPLIRKASERGFETHVFAWEKGAVGKEEADYFYPVSITEKETILEYCRRIKPEAAATIGSDLAEVTVNYLTNHLGLPGNPPETAVFAVNKYIMRKKLREAGLYTPRFIEAGSFAEAEEKGLGSFPLPFIIKPVDRSGSRGINRIDDYGQAEAAFREACGHSFEKKAIAEEYMEGAEYSCEGISSEGRHYLLQVTKKYTTGSPHFIETAHIEPCGLSGEMLEKVRETVFRVLDALHIRNGASHTELRISGGGEIRLIETGARMGGDCIGSDLVPLTTGYDYVGMVLDTAFGRMPDFTVSPHRAAAGIRFIMNRRDLEYFESLQKKAPEAIVRSFIEERDLSAVPGDSGSRHGFFLIAGDDTEEVRRMIENSGI